MIDTNKICILDQLLDENNKDNIILSDDEGNSYEFEQVAIFPEDGVLYCILHPITAIEGVEKDEAVVFKVTEEGDISIEEDKLKILEIFDQYYELLEEQLEKEWRKKK